MEFACHDYNMVQKMQAPCNEISLFDHVDHAVVKYIYILWSFCQADGSADNWRYQLSAKTKISVYNPKALNADIDMMNLRGSMFGCCCHDNFDKIPRNKIINVLFEVSCCAKGYCILGLNVWQFFVIRKMFACFFCHCLDFEVVCEQGVPCVITPRKPKMWLVCNLTLRGRHAHLIK